MILYLINTGDHIANTHVYYLFFTGFPFAFTFSHSKLLLMEKVPVIMILLVSLPVMVSLPGANVPATTQEPVGMGEVAKIGFTTVAV